MSRAKLPGLTPEAERAVLAQLDLLDRRLVAVESTPPQELALLSSNFTAREGQTVVIAAPATGLSGLLPKPRQQNRFARIHLVFTTDGPVMLSCTDGTVNGGATLTHDVAGAYTAVCDGALGWWLESLDTAAHLRGKGLTVDSAGKLQTRFRPRHAMVQDWFLSGDNATGSIGALGWNLLGTGTPAYARSSPTTMGSTNRGALSTSAGANDRSCLTLGETETRDILPPTGLQILQCAWNHNNNLTNKRIFFGLIGTFANDPAAAVDCLGVYYDSAVNANYQIIARSGSTGSPVVTALATPANTAELMTLWQETSGAFSFYSGATFLGTISSNIPTNAMNVGFRLETLTTAAKTVNVGYFGLEAEAAAAFNDDDFLEV